MDFLNKYSSPQGVPQPSHPPPTASSRPPQRTRSRTQSQPQQGQQQSELPVANGQRVDASGTEQAVNMHNPDAVEKIVKEKVYFGYLLFLSCL